MERPQLYAAIGLVAVALVVMGCGDRESPVEPTPPPVTPAPQEFSLSGWVGDTAFRSLGGSRVEVIDARVGTVATTDEHGHYYMPGTFTGTITLMASKDGYVSQTRTWTPPPLRAPGPPVVEFKGWVGFYLELPGQSPADIAGVYTLTLTAARACTSLPTEVRTRTYTATIVPGDRPSSFRGTLSDARFPSKCPAGHVPESCKRNALSIGTAGDDVGIGVSIVEQVGETTHLVVDANAEGSLGPIGITAPLDGVFLYCPIEPVLVYEGLCLDSAGVECYSTNHQLTLVRR